MLMWIGVAVGVLVLGFVALMIWARATAPSRFPLGSLAFEAELTLDPLTRTIASRRSELAAAPPERAAELRKEIVFLEEQVLEIQAIVDRRDPSPGRGYVGFDAYGATESSWAKASRARVAR